MQFKVLDIYVVDIYVGIHMFFIFYVFYVLFMCSKGHQRRN